MQRHRTHRSSYRWWTASLITLGCILYIVTSMYVTQPSFQQPPITQRYMFNTNKSALEQISVTWKSYKTLINKTSVTTVRKTRFRNLHKPIWVVPEEDLVTPLDTSLFLTEEDFGLTHITIPHLLYSETSRNHSQDTIPDSGAGTLHLWLKALIPTEQDIQNNPHLQHGAIIRGALFFESTANPLNSEEASVHHYRMPSAFYNNVPRLTLHAINKDGSAAEEGLPLDLLWGKVSDRTWAITANLTTRNSLYLLRLSSWPRTAVYRPAYFLKDSPSHPWEYHMVITPYARVHPQIPARLLDHHITYHAHLGFSRWLYYVKDAYLVGNAMQKRLTSYVEDGTVLMLRWGKPYGYNPEIWWHPDQGIIYNHAMLAYSGMNVYLALIDLDEYLAVPQPISHVAQLRGTCFQNAVLATFPRQDVHCNACSQQDPELAIWTQEPPYRFNVKHPLQNYDLVGRQYNSSTHGKSILDPNWVYAWFVHDGQIWPGLNESESYAQPATGCGSWVHVTNMFQERDHVTSNNVTQETSWHWIFGNIA